MSADQNESVDGELILDGVVVPFRSQQPEQEDDAANVRGPELSSMRQVLRTQGRVYRLIHTGKISSSDGERRIKALAVMFEELKFLDFEQGITEQLARLEQDRNLDR